MHRESLMASLMNYLVSGYVYFVAFTLVLYMVSSLLTGMLELATSLLDLSLASKSILSAPERSTLEHNLLHTIAFTIVLVKAYKILIAYADTRHINLKFLVEIAIIAPTIELIFNARAYSLEVNMLFAGFAFLNLVAYLYFYHTLKAVSLDYYKENFHGVPTEDLVIKKHKKPAKISKVTATE
jgi:uncharacterized membrane protein (DUF373 family)